MTAKTFWNNKSDNQDAYNQLWDKFVPESGPANTVYGEILRTVSNMYYRMFNDGDMFLSAKQIKLLKDNTWVFNGVANINVFDFIVDTDADNGPIRSNPYYDEEYEEYCYPRPTQTERDFLYTALEIIVNNVVNMGKTIAALTAENI